VESEAGRRRNGVLRRRSIGAFRQIIAGRQSTADARWGIFAILRQRIGLLWAAMALAVVVYVFHQGVGLGGPGSDIFFDRWLNDGLLWVSAFACLGGALSQTRGRVAWLLLSLALASWAIGDTVFSIRFGTAASIPAASISDVFWLAWYPLVVAGLVLLVRDRVPGFELHRFVDGIAVMLLVATPWVALFLQPVVEHSDNSRLAQVLDFIYPLSDAVLFGATLGVFALMAWRPSRMWVALGLALLVMGLADAFYSVDATGHAHDHGIYDGAWVGGAALVAFASWEPHPGQLAPRKVTGWAAIALPLGIGALAVSIQLYAFFHEIPRSERILTVIVLLIGMFQIVLARPRRESGREGGDRDPPVSPRPRDPPGGPLVPPGGSRSEV
jgi:hypothetical protein